MSAAWGERIPPTRPSWLLVLLLSAAFIAALLWAFIHGQDSQCHWKLAHHSPDSASYCGSQR